MPALVDNKFRIILYALEIYSLIGGEFYVKDHSITPGEPTDIKNGATLYTDRNGEFNFRVGRKKSDNVAKWFNRQCDTSKCTTFGQAAGQLNFAFLGTLKLTVSYKSKKQYTVIFDDILIAQGRGGATNNWWFGGKRCFKVNGSYEVESRGVTESNDGFRFTFLRGTNGVNSAVIKNINFLTWMKNIEDSKLLNQINIPGTHDSGTYNYNTLVTRNYVKTQSLSIRQQLNLGIRYLDIRCRHDDNAFQIYHGDYNVHLNFDDVLEQCVSFLNENESESIVILISEEGRPKDTNRAFYKTFLDYYVNKTSEYWYRGKTIPSMKDARKKLILMHRFYLGNAAFGMDSNNWSDNASFKIYRRGYTLAVQDEYDVSFGNKERAIRAMVDSSKERKYQYWYLNYISLAPSAGRGTIAATSRYTNKIIHKIATTERTSFLGMVIMDYPENQKWLTSDIIDNNDYF